MRHKHLYYPGPPCYTQPVFHTNSNILITTSVDSLVKQLEAGLAHTHFLLDPKLWNSGVLRRTLPAENLTTGSTVVLGKHRTQNEVDFHTCAVRRYRIHADTHSQHQMNEGNHKTSKWPSYKQARPTFLVITPNWTLHRWHSSASTQSGA